MAAQRCDPDYLPIQLALDFNFLPDEEALSEFWDLGNDEYMVRLASLNIPSNCLFKYDHNWGY